VIDDHTGLRLRDVVGMDQLMFEVDFPHGDTLWPDSRPALEKLVAETGLDDDEVYKLVRGNAIRFYRLDRYGITA
jgi:predicted TIM-barrel fold metal-dependent hydrolase